MMVHRRERKRPLAEINVVPYIDVMLVLLVIFMVTTPLLTQGVKVNLPRASAQTIPPKSAEPLIVSVDAQGNYYINISSTPNQPVDANTLVSLTSNQLQKDTSEGLTRPVLVKGDKSVNYGSVMQAMVLLQQAGAPSVGLVTQQPDPSTTAMNQ